MKYKINYGETTLPISIKKAEELKDAKYIGDFCLRNKSGGWSESPVAVFYQPNPPKNFSKYFGLFLAGDNLFITNAESAFAEPIQGLVGSNGEVVYSRYRHDFRSLSDGSGAIDGGRDYVKVTGNQKGEFPPQVTLVIKGPRLVVVEPGKEESSEDDERVV